MNLSYRTDKNARAIAAYWGKSLEDKDWFSIKALSDDETEIFLYSVVGWPWNDAGEIVRALSSLKGKNVKMRINTPGGDVFDGLSIANAATSHGNVNMVIEGLAASIGSVIPLSGKTIKMYQSSMIMMHESWTIVPGNKHELKNAIDVLDKVDGNIIDAYAEHTDIGKREWRSMIENKEVWWTAKEAKEHGFVDEIISGKGTKAQFDLSMFNNVPDNLYANEEKTIFTGFDVEKALRDAKAPKGFAKAVAAACRAANLVDRCHADDKIDNDNLAVANEAVNKAGINELKAEIEKLTSRLKQC